jgi:DNA polymerase-3 subunit delta
MNPYYYFVANPKASNIIPNLALLFNFFVRVLQIHANPNAGDEQLCKKRSACG